MRFKNIFMYAAALSMLALSGCAEKTDPSEIDSATRIALSKDIPVFTASGNTEDGEDAYRAIVTIVQGDKINGIGWDYSLDDPKQCAEVSVTDVSEDFIGTYEGDSRTYTGKGLMVKMKANSEYKRSFSLTIKAADGTERAFEFTQKGEKADAAVSTDTKDVEFFAEGGEQTISYTSNMGDAYSFTVDYEGESKDWLSCEATEAGSVKLIASGWNDHVNVRKAVLHITVGSAETSMASVDVPVTQLAADIYYFMYGSSAAGLEIDKALQMTKESEDIYSVKAYFMNAKAGANTVMFNQDSRVLSYPCYALAKDGSVTTIESAASAMPEGPEIDVDGLRSLVVNFNEKTWNWSRISTLNSMPDSEVSKYKTKAFIARDGSMKVWMVENMRWNGGDIKPRLGSPMIPSATGVGAKGTGGYGASAFPSSWDDPKLNMAYECTEIGGQLEGSDERGRIYAFSEIVTGVPTNGIGFARKEVVPKGWTAGSEITDAVGDNYTIEYLNNKSADTFSGDNTTDEKNHPTLKMQIQGICPYGWHIANASDWLDLAYAASKASAGHSYPLREDQITYKQFTTASGTAVNNNPVSPRGIGNLAAWLRNKTWWSAAVSDGADEFGFEYFPLGWRYMTQGYQCYGVRAQVWVPLFFSDKALYRINVILDNTVTYAEMTNIDNGQAIMPFRCVKNYK